MTPRKKDRLEKVLYYGMLKRGLHIGQEEWKELGIGKMSRMFWSPKDGLFRKDKEYTSNTQNR